MNVDVCVETITDAGSTPAGSTLSHLTLEAFLTAHIYLGLIRGPAHECILRTVANWLNDNKFPCEFSISSNCVTFIIRPRPEDADHWGHPEFYQYAMELTLHALVKHMAKVPV